jgi:DNA repair protein RadC
MRSSIKHWPADERPREKLLQKGAATLTDAELLALILRTGDAGSGTSALDQGRNLLQQFGNLHNLANATTQELCRFPGIGPAKAAEVQGLFELAKRYQSISLKPGDRYTSSSEVYRHYHALLRDRKKEVFLALLLDSKNRLIREVCVSEGSLNASIVHPREVFSPAVRESAAAVLFIHNHPSGDPAPSREDIDLTRRLREAGELMGIRVLDHIVIGNGSYVSFTDRGL